MNMTAKVITDACRANGGYATPEHNDQIFLQCKGLGKIQNLTPYVNVKALWLDSNSILEIEGLEACTKLAALYLNNNYIPRICGLEGLMNLHTLNLSHNVISEIRNLAHLPRLETLLITNNRLTHLADLEELTRCLELSCVDLSYNPLEAAEGEGTDEVVGFFKRVPKLAVLYLTGTEIVKGLRYYRKKMITGMPGLQYLDDRPIFEQERRTAEAWATGGDEAEKLVRQQIHEEKKESLIRPVRDLQKRAEEKRHIKEARTAEWAKIQEKEDQWWRSKTECFRDLNTSEHEDRENIEDEEKNTFVADLQSFESELKDIADAEEVIRRESAEKIRRQKEEAEKRSPMEESRQELLRHIAMWGPEGGVEPPGVNDPQEDTAEDADSEALLLRFQEEVHAALYDLGMGQGSTLDSQQPSAFPVTSPATKEMPTPKPSKQVPSKERRRWRDIAVGDWTPPASTVALWEKAAKWESR